MGYNIAGNFVKCLKCGAKNFWDLLIAIGLSKKDAYALIKTIPSGYIEDRPKPEGLKLPPSVPLVRGHRSYLMRRGFDPSELVNLWDIQSIKIHAKFGWRILIPIRDPRHGNDVVSFTTRATGKTDMRYLSASHEEESIPHSSLIYGMEYIQQSAVIVEGPTDVWAVGPGCGGTLGTDVTDEQVDVLMSIPRRLLLFDSSRAAQRRAKDLKSRLWKGTTDIWTLKTGEDPAAADEGELDDVRAWLGPEYSHNHRMASGR